MGKVPYVPDIVAERTRGLYSGRGEEKRWVLSDKMADFHDDGNQKMWRSFNPTPAYTPSKVYHTRTGVWNGRVIFSSFMRGSDDECT